MRRLVLVLSLVVTGCMGEAEKTAQTSNQAFQVQQLFEHEGCKVFRFYDSLSPRYFVNCAGRTMRSEQHYCGKNCTYQHDEEIPTEVTR